MPTIIMSELQPMQLKRTFNFPIKYHCRMHHFPISKKVLFYKKNIMVQSSAQVVKVFLY